MAIQNPIMEMFNGLRKEMLPTVGIIPAINENFKEGNVEQQTFDAMANYNVVLEFVAKGAGKAEALYQHEQGKKVGKTKRNFGEIVSLDDLKSRCLDFHKGCGIAMLPALTISEYEKENSEQHV